MLFLLVKYTIFADGVSGGRLGADKVVLDIRDKTGTAQFSDDKFSVSRVLIVYYHRAL